MIDIRHCVRPILRFSRPAILFDVYEIGTTKDHLFDGVAKLNFGLYLYFSAHTWFHWARKNVCEAKISPRSIEATEIIGVFSRERASTYPFNVEEPHPPDAREPGLMLTGAKV